jgi:protein arginine kinase activator
MLCDICKKREATVHLTEVINDEVSELHICEKCAEAKGAQMQQHFGIADLLSGLVDLPYDMVPKKKRINIKCPSCGMSYNNFKKMGRFGCADCYETFKRALYPLFKKIHGVSYRARAGKEPKKPSGLKPVTTKDVPKPGIDKDNLRELKARLAEVIELEEFEKAAVLRDKIRVLEARDKETGTGSAEGGSAFGGKGKGKK